MLARRILLVTPVVLHLAGCNCGPGPVDVDRLQGLAIGVEPVPGPDDAGLPATEFIASLGALDGLGGFAMPPSDRIVATCDAPGGCPASTAGVTRPGTSQGLLAIVLDDSGSNGASPSTCVGCPTDPKGQRIEAVRVLLRRLFGRAPEWRVALFDFGWTANGGRVAAAHLAGYTSYEADFDAALKAITPGYGTYLYDSLLDVIPSLVGEQQALSARGPVPARVLVISDGEDTSSVGTLAQALSLAKERGITIDAVGYGQRGDAGTVVLAPKGYRDLRRLAAETGGLCTVVDADTLPATFARIAELYVAGYAERRFSMPAGVTTVKGIVGLGSTAATPFSFEDFR